MNNEISKQIINNISEKIQSNKEIQLFKDIIILLINENNINQINDFLQGLHSKFGSTTDIVDLFEILTNKDYAPYECHYNFAVSFEERYRYYDEKCINALQKCLKINPNLADVIFHLANAFEHNGNKEEAIKSWIQYLKIAPQNKYYNNGLISLMNLIK